MEVAMLTGADVSGAYSAISSVNILSILTTGKADEEAVC